MGISGFIREHIKAGRKRGTFWSRIIDIVRLLPTSEGRARLWTVALHRSEIHQTSPDTAEERYPFLFDMAQRLLPNATHILSFGCSTGQELISLRKRYPRAMLVGAEINGRSRRIATQRLGRDTAVAIIPPKAIGGQFDIIFALAVLQREPHKIVEMDVTNLGAFYAFELFDRTVADLVERLRPGGLFCVANAQYRVEDSCARKRLKPIADAPLSACRIFAPSGERLVGKSAATMFVKI